MYSRVLLLLLSTVFKNCKVRADQSEDISNVMTKTMFPRRQLTSWCFNNLSYQNDKSTKCVRRVISQLWNSPTAKWLFLRTLRRRQHSNVRADSSFRVSALTVRIQQPSCCTEQACSQLKYTTMHFFIYSYMFRPNCSFFRVSINKYLKCVDKPTSCNPSYEWSLLSINWLYMFRTITSQSSGASSHKL